jgi:hypothetical protein
MPRRGRRHDRVARDSDVGVPGGTRRGERIRDRDAPVPRPADTARVHELDVVGGHTGGGREEAAEGGVGGGRPTGAGEHEHAGPGLLELDELAVSRDIHSPIFSHPAPIGAFSL